MNYQSDFDTLDYLKRYYSTVNGSEEENMDNFYYKNLHEIFEMEFIKGDWLLDVGTGPTLQTTMFSSRKYKNVILSEFSKRNRNELVKWLKGDADSFDWSSYFNYVAKLESVDKQLIMQRTKNAVKAVVPIDVNEANTISPNWFPKFDCILTSLALEAACLSVPSYKQAIKNLNNLLKQNGYLIMVGVLNESFYVVGDIKWPTCKLTIEDIREAMQESNFSIIYERVKNVKRSEYLTSDFTGLFVIVGKLN